NPACGSGKRTFSLSFFDSNVDSRQVGQWQHTTDAVTRYLLSHIQGVTLQHGCLELAVMRSGVRSPLAPPLIHLPVALTTAFDDKRESSKSTAALRTSGSRWR